MLLGLLSLYILDQLIFLNMLRVKGKNELRAAISGYWETHGKWPSSFDDLPYASAEYSVWMDARFVQGPDGICQMRYNEWPGPFVTIRKTVELVPSQPDSLVRLRERRSEVVWRW